MKRRLRPVEEAVMLDAAGVRKLDSAWFRNLISECSVTEILIGCDEVGNGAWYGPICVGAVAILNGWHIDGIKDSKDIRRENVRRALAAEIRHNTVWQVGMIHADRLEEIGPYKALKLLQHAVISNLAQRLSTSFPRATITAVLDGAGDTETHPTYSLKCVPKADSLIYEVSAASILAKATRDDWVHEQVKSDPGLARYKLDDNKGYGTPAHTQALQTWGLTPHHRAKACRGQMKGTRHEHSTPLCG